MFESSFVFFFFVIFPANFKKKYKYAKIDQNIWCGSIVMSIFTKRPKPAKMMLHKASSPLWIPVAVQC